LILHETGATSICLTIVFVTDLICQSTQRPNHVTNPPHPFELAIVSVLRFDTVFPNPVNCCECIRVDVRDDVHLSEHAGGLILAGLSITPS